MAAGFSNSAAGVLIQLSEASNLSSDEQDNGVDDTISIILSTSNGLMSSSEARDGDSSSATTIESTSRKAPSFLFSKLMHQIYVRKEYFSKFNQ